VSESLAYFLLSYVSILYWRQTIAQIGRHPMKLGYAWAEQLEQHELHYKHYLGEAKHVMLMMK